MMKVPPAKCKKSRSSGMALISALLVIIVVTSILSTIYYNQTVKFRQVENASAISQSRWLLHAMTDGLRYFFQDNLSHGSQFNHLGEIWAIPLTDVNLATILKKYNVVDNALNLNNISVTYNVEDAQGRFNLTNLVVLQNDGAEKEKYINQMFKALAIEYGLSEAMTSSIIGRLKFFAKINNSSPGSAQALEIDKRAFFDGFEPSERAKLVAFFVVLPEKTKINANTTKDVVLKTLIPEASAETVRRFAARRLNNPFKSTDEIQAFLEDHQHGIKFNSELVTVRTDYFKIYAAIRSGDVVLSRAILVGRKAGLKPVTTIIDSEPEQYRFLNEK